jgi:hypothetical protein
MATEENQMPMHDWTRLSAGSFHTFHTAWITELARALNNGVLPEGFYAESEQVAGQTGPDVLTLAAVPDWTAEDRTHALESAGATTIVAAPPEVSVTQVASEQEVYAEKRNRLVIRHSSGDVLIAYIEIISSGNKSSRRALDRFLDKACSAIEQGVHLLVIDPYPPGTFDPKGIHGAIWNEIDPAAPFHFPDDRKLTLASYCAARPPQAYVELLAAGMPLPGTALFLNPQWYVTVPLESTYCAAWEAIPARWRQVLAE